MAREGSGKTFDIRYLGSSDSVVGVAWLCCIGLVSFLVVVVLRGDNGHSSGAALLLAPLPLILHIFVAGGRRPLGAGYWLILAFGILNVTVNPILVGLLGANLSGLPSEPSTGSLNTVAVLNAVVLCAGLTGYLATPQAPGERAWDAYSGTLPIVLCLALGAVGAVLKVSRFGGISAYLAGSFMSGQGAPGSSWVGLASTVLPPFWVSGCVLLWQKYQERVTGLLRIFLFAIAVAPMLLYSYNRAAFMVPAASLVLTSMGSSGRPLRRRGVAMWAGVLSAGAWIWGEWRRVFWATAGGTRSLEQAGISGDGPTVCDVWQVYTAAQPRAAVTLEIMEGHNGTLWSSILAAVPRIGEPWRAGSGPVVFNTSLYGSGGAADQILPTMIEAQATSAWICPIVLFLLVGALLRRLEPSKKRSLFENYFRWYVCIWIASTYVFSVSILLQIVVFFLWSFLLVYVLGRSNSITGSTRPGRRRTRAPSH